MKNGVKYELKLGNIELVYDNSRSTSDPKRVLDISACINDYHRPVGLRLTLNVYIINFRS